MKKVFLAIATVAMVFATSCKQESVNPATDEVPEGSFLCIIDNDAMPQNAPRVSNGMNTMTTTDGKYVFWKQGDEIDVNGVTFTNSSSSKATATFSNTSITSFTGPYYAFYPAGIQSAGGGAAGTLQATIEVDSDNNAANLPMYAYSTNNTLTFTNICAVLEIKVPEVANGATSIVVSNTTGYLNGDFAMNGNYAEISSDAAATRSMTTTVTRVNNSTFTKGDLIYVAIPKGTYDNFEIEFLNGTTSLLSRELTSITVDVNKIYPVVFVSDLLEGKFTVNGNGKQVKFTRGNLLCDKNNTTYTLYFETNQTGYPSSLVPSTTTGIGYFSWQPTIEVASDINSYGSRRYDEETGALIADWGVSDSYFTTGGISNATVHETTGLRALTESEWNYLLNSRSNMTERYKPDVTVGGVEHCLVIAPDGFNESLESEYTLNELLQKNLVCLTPAGYATRTFMPQVSRVDSGTVGYYNTTNKKLLKFDASGVTLVDACIYVSAGLTSGDRYVHTPVRLVQDVTNN